MRANTGVRVSYVGNRGVHLERQFNLNDPPPAPGPVQPRRPFQPFGPITYFESGRDSTTHQLQIGAIRRFASGLAFQFEYQWTKALGEQVSVPPMDNRNPRLDRGNLDFIRRHWATLNYIYELPFGEGETLRELSFPRGGEARWQLADQGHASFGTGQPYSVTFTSDARMAEQPGGPRRRPVSRGPHPRPMVQSNGVHRAGAIRLRQLRAKLLFGPGFVSWDAAIFKHTASPTGSISSSARSSSTSSEPSVFRPPGSDISAPAQSAGSRQPRTAGTFSSACVSASEARRDGNSERHRRSRPTVGLTPRYRWRPSPASRPAEGGYSERSAATGSRREARRAGT